MVKKAKRGRQELLALGLPEGPVSEGRPGKRAAAAAASEAIARSADEEGRRFSIAAASAAVSPSKLPSPRLTAEEQVTADEVAAAAREADLQLRREAFDALMANTIHRGRRKQRTSNPSNRAGGFANSPLRVSVIPEDPLPIEGDLDALVQAAMEVRVSLGLPHDKPLNLRQVMKAGILVAQPVEFRSRHGDVMLRGSVASDGLIACGCRNCSGARVSCSDFEEHAGSRERRPGENIFLSSINTSLRDFCMAVNARLGLAQVPKGTWYCSACTAAGVAQRAKPPKHATPRKLQHGSAAAVVPKRKLEDGRLDGTCVSPAGRVHMAAPSSRGMTGARRERNSNKHKRLFMGEPGGLRNGEKVAYITAQGERLLEGVVRITSSANGGADASGILCGCCNIVISCSQFEAHAGRGTRRAPYDNIYTTKGVSLRKMAAALPPHVSESPHHYQAASSALARQQGDAVDSTDDPEVVAGRGREAMGDLDIVAGGCVLCNQTDFQRGTFGARTIIICDQCEREFHVGCLKKFGRGHLHELPDGDWFCSPECHSINDSLRARVLAGPVPISGDHTWQLLRGKDGTHATTWALKSAAELLQESFDPIIDIISGQDLLNVMVYAQELGEWDYTGMYTAVLRHKGKPVAAAVFRVFGPQLAELPLVATRLTARRQGHARVLIRAFEAMLAQAGVQCLSLPAAHETVGTWMHGFGFAHMPAEQLRAARSELRLLIFPGTEVLCKPLVKPAEALPPAQLLPSPAPPAAEAAQKASPDPSPRAALQAQARDQRRHRGRANNPDPAAAGASATGDCLAANDT
ncbi:hypothetical protein WJX72_009121 [[Myrmecia] bisecta]|uniref:N-acetyltransferase domain-containing protein n=1 Tax=[Myrmecia] bisecta TaxID=41462 RepID=A0AAW1PPD3_9CHLO